MVSKTDSMSCSVRDCRATPLVPSRSCVLSADAVVSFRATAMRRCRFLQQTANMSNTKASNPKKIISVRCVTDRDEGFSRGPRVPRMLRNDAITMLLMVFSVALVIRRFCVHTFCRSASGFYWHVSSGLSTATRMWKVCSRR